MACRNLCGSSVQFTEDKAKKLDEYPCLVQEQNKLLGMKVELLLIVVGPQRKKERKKERKNLGKESIIRKKERKKRKKERKKIILRNKEENKFKKMNE